MGGFTGTNFTVNDGPAQQLAAGGPTLAAFEFPINGVSETWARSAQPALTTPDCLNVLPYDLSGRARGGVRPGITQCGVTTYGGGGGTNEAIAQYVGQITVEVGTNSAYVPHVAYGVISPYIRYATRTQASAGRAEFIVLVAGGQAYFGTASASLAVIGGAGPKVQRDTLVNAAALDGKLYLVDGGTNICMIDFTVAPPVWATYAATAGTSPASTGPRYCCVYRKRLIVGGGLLDTNPENFYAARLGTPTDWNYSAPDPGSAFAGNASKGGQVGEPLTGFVPINDDYLLIGCDRSIWLMTGDIANQGQIDVLTRGVGMIGQSATCFDPQGNLYFLGSNGFYRIARGTYALENLSLANYPSYFNQPQLAASTVTVYDKDRHGIWIFRTPMPKGTAPTQVWWDHRSGGFFPQQLPAAIGPLVACLYEHAGNAVARELLLAGFASAGGSNPVELYAFNGTVATDAGAAISSYAWLGPARPDGPISRNALLTACDFVLGETPAGFAGGDWNVTYLLQSGNGPYAAYASPDFTATGTFTGPGRQRLQRGRLRGESFMLKLSNATGGKIWSVDQVQGQFRPAGRVRV